VMSGKRMLPKVQTSLHDAESDRRIWLPPAPPGEPR
jgi:hypothetical protein